MFPRFGYCSLTKMIDQPMSSRIEIPFLREENEQRSHRSSSIKCSREHIYNKKGAKGQGWWTIEKHIIDSTLTVVFCPPIKMSFPNHIVEYETNERPGDKVHSSCWRYLACASQHHRDAEWQDHVGCHQTAWLSNTYLTYLKKLVGHLLLISHPTSGARAPIKKK